MAIMDFFPSSYKVVSPVIHQDQRSRASYTWYLKSLIQLMIDWISCQDVVLCFNPDHLHGFLKALSLCWTEMQLHAMT